MSGDCGAGVARTPTAPGDTTPIVIFDFDGTLVSRDSLFDFSVRYCLARPARVLAIIALSPVALLATLRSTDAALSVLIWAMTIRGSTRELVVELRRYAREILSLAANEQIFAELEAHLRIGNRVAIATGSVPLMVRALLTARGLPPLPIAGSRLRRKWGGLIAVTHCTGQIKVDELQRRFGISRWAAVYTNSFADRALMLRAPEITLVGPSRRTLRLTQRLAQRRSALRVLLAR